MPIDTLEKLFVEELKDLYSAEHQITKAIPKLVKASTSPQLKEALENHLSETENQIVRLEKIFEILGKGPRGKVCNGMKGVLEEGAEMIEETADGEVRDTGLISAAQRVEHYEMAGYGSVKAFAEILGETEIVKLIDQTLQEEKAADKKLTELSRTINELASQEK